MQEINVAYNIIADFFNLINLGLFDTATMLMIMGFILWEIPRSFKVISEEYTKGLYPEHGRVVDFVLLGIGLIAVFFFMDNAKEIVAFLKKPGITSFFLILMVTIPLIIFFGFIKRLFGRMEGNESITVFLAQGFLDLMHTLFYIGLTILLIPGIGFLFLG